MSEAALAQSDDTLNALHSIVVHPAGEPPRGDARAPATGQLKVPQWLHMDVLAHWSSPVAAAKLMARAALCTESGSIIDRIFQHCLRASWTTFNHDLASA